jgi:hypothetical protein
MPNEQHNPVGGTFSKLMGRAPKTEQTKQAENKISNKVDNKSINKVSNITSNITILQSFSSKDIEELREPAYMSQTFRLRDQDIEWVKDTAHVLSKEFKRRKISQTDIVRISFKLFDKLLKSNKENLKELLDKIK